MRRLITAKTGLAAGSGDGSGGLQLPRRAAGVARRVGALATGAAVMSALAVAGAVAGAAPASASSVSVSCVPGAASVGVRILTRQTLTFTMTPSTASCLGVNLSAASVGTLSLGGTGLQPGYGYAPVGNGPISFVSTVTGTAVVGFSNGPMVTITIAAPAATDVGMTLTYDASGGSCSDPAGAALITGFAYQWDWLALPSAASCSRPGYTLSGWSTGPGGTGTVFTPGQTVQVTSNNTLYAVWSPASAPAASPAVTQPLGPPQSVSVRTVAVPRVAQMSAQVSWQPGSGTATEFVATTSAQQSCRAASASASAPASTSCTIDRLKPGHSTSVSVTASNAAGVSGSSAVVPVPGMSITSRTVSSTASTHRVQVTGSSAGLMAQTGIRIWICAPGRSAHVLAALPVRTNAAGNFAWTGSVPIGSSVLAADAAMTVISPSIRPTGR